MKKAFLVLALATLGTQLAHAGDVYCGINIEGTPGSGSYNKNVLLEKADANQTKLRFLLADGSILKVEDLTPDNRGKVIDGTRGITIVLKDGKPQLSVSRVALDVQKQIRMTKTALSVSQGSSDLMLLADDTAVFCSEQK